MSLEGDAGSVPIANSSTFRGLETGRKTHEQNYDYEGWKISILKGPILPSNCYCSSMNTTNNASDTIIVGSNELQDEEDNNTQDVKCQVCRFASELSLKHLPEMVFSDTILRLVYLQTGFTLEFTALDGMKLIPLNAESVHVACSADWKASQAETGVQLPGETTHNYNWTFGTEYRGTVVSKSIEGSEVGQIEVDPPEKLDLEKLKQREKILFYDELTLYEDELHDNGVSNLTVKIRVMPSGFFILLRFFLRVDKVMARMCDTRIHFESGNTYFLRQFQVREESFPKLANLEPQVIADPNLLYRHLSVLREVTEKVKIA